MTGAKVWLKFENLQMTGSFKERGACNKLLCLTEEERARGIICASAGNHAQGVAYHAALLNIDATIVMPEGTPVVKVQSTREFLGAHGRVILAGANFDEACERATAIRNEEDRIFVHAFDDDLVIAGQGTIGLELLEQNPYLEAVVVAVGGGGLIGGVSVAIKETNPRIKVYGVETEVLPSMLRAIEAHAPVTVPAARTIAEGIAVRAVSQRTLDLVNRYVDGVVTVDEEEIARAILLLLEREKTVAEGAGAVPLAALLGGHFPTLAGKKVGLIVCGGNIDVNVISRIIERGLVRSGRIVRLEVRIADVAGSLARLTTLLGSLHASIIEIHHDRTFSDAALNETMVELVLETRGFEHAGEIVKALAEAGYSVETHGPKLRGA
jgi:threonine dehydratase